jgi:thiopurine S-methyltransferase
MQKDYAAKLAALTPRGVPVLLVTLDYDPSEMDGPPFPISPQRVEELFGQNFRLTLLEKRDGLSTSQNLKKRGVSRLDEAAWKLVRR